MATFDLESLMEGTIRQLRTDAEYFSKLTTHAGEKGRLNETHLVRVLRNYLPDKFGVGTGFILSGGASIQQSRQCDIVIYDRSNNTPFYSSEAWQIFPIEMVYGVIEVKTTLNKTTIKSALESCVLLRRMSGGDQSPNKAYVRQSLNTPRSSVRYEKYRSGLPPRFFIFGYSGPRPTTLKKLLADATLENTEAHLHGLCMLGEKTSLFAGHEPFKAPEERLRVLESNGMLNFLQELPKALSSMLPVFPLMKSADDEGRGVFAYRPEHFDVVDLDHYRDLNLRSWSS